MVMYWARQTILRGSGLQRKVAGVQRQDWGYSSVEDHLPSMHQALGSISSSAKKQRQGAEGHLDGQTGTDGEQAPSKAAQIMEML